MQPQHVGHTGMMIVRSGGRVYLRLIGRRQRRPINRIQTYRNAAMATLAPSRPATIRRPDFLSKLLGKLAAWNDRRQTLNALIALSDRELDDLGLSRADLRAGIIRRR
jgi:uncharacterized protein YjiS (DUF1127 family)